MKSEAALESLFTLVHQASTGEACRGSQTKAGLLDERPDPSLSHQALVVEASMSHRSRVESLEDVEVALHLLLIDVLIDLKIYDL